MKSHKTGNVNHARRKVKMWPLCVSIFISVENPGRCLGQASVIHGESKHVSPFPMWLRARLLTFNCSPNNAYWFLPKIFAHDWHFRHTWPVAGLLLTHQQIRVRFFSWWRTKIWSGYMLQSTINKATSKLSHSIISSLSVSDLYFEVLLDFT